MSAEVPPTRKRPIEDYEGMLTPEQVERTKNYLAVFAHDALARAEGSSRQLLDTTTVQVQLPVVQHPQALYDLNTVIPGIVARLISELENLDFATVDENGVKRVAPGGYFDTLLSGVVQLERLYRTYTRGRGAVQGFEANFNARVSPFLTSLAESVKRDTITAEKRKLESYDSSSRKLAEVNDDLKAFKGRLEYHDWSRIAPTDALKSLTNMHKIPTVPRFATKQERSCITFLTSLYDKIFI